MYFSDMEQTNTLKNELVNVSRQLTYQNTILKHNKY